MSAAPQSVLADSGPLAALFNRRDKHHLQAMAYFEARGARLKLLTTWEVVSEVSYFLDFSAEAQGGFLAWLHAGAERGLLELAALQVQDLPGVANMMRKCADRPTGRWTSPTRRWSGWPIKLVSPTSSP